MRIETTVIGAGVVGLAVAAALSETSRHIFLVDKNESFGKETSSRNSEVIHAGIYYPAGSLKARLCVKGNRMMYALCAKRRIPHRQCGKIIVATRPEEESYLEALKEKAEANGVQGMEMLTGARIAALEPEVKAVSGLYSPATGIINSHRLMRYFVAQAQKNRVQIVYQTTVTRVEKAPGGGYRIHVVYPDGDTDRFTTDKVVNCGGLTADRIAESMGIDLDAHRYRQYLWKGEYFGVDRAPGILKRLVYPVPLPNNEGLGIHATIDLSGRLKLGPNAVYLPEKQHDYTVDPKGREAFHRAAVRYLPSLRPEELQPEMAGIRPKLQKPGDGVRDFIISEESDKGLPGVVNLLGIESPGLTSCLAIAEYVGELLAGWPVWPVGRFSRLAGLAGWSR